MLQMLSHRITIAEDSSFGRPTLRYAVQHHAQDDGYVVDLSVLRPTQLLGSRHVAVFRPFRSPCLKLFKLIN